MTGVDWSDRENDVVVLAYFDMLHRELRQEPYVKAKVNDEVRRVTGRSKGSVEFKFANVSAVLREMHHPFILGYQPRSKFQDSLRDAVLRHIGDRADLEESALEAALRIAQSRVDVDFDLKDPPHVELSDDYQRHRRAAKRDYVQLDAANRSLGHAGEVAIVDLERRRLRAAGATRLAAKVEHVSETQGDGLGFDILSFSPDGDEKWIEVNTTRFGIAWPMLISRNEVATSQEQPERFRLYRVFDFDAPRPGLYELRGPVTSTCQLVPETFHAVPA
ncbi:MAG TPA: DUF3883 domain-containing protein [Dermatophilaceae bacterium]|nr:DUF3883 domain-containing protein [Dermatophilaceae bacterium]